MPPPFPGMDPYLEDPGLWPDVHHNLISVMQELLNRQLRPKYYVRVEERVYISDDYDPGRTLMVPDLRIATRPGNEGMALSPGGVVVADIAEPVVMATLIEEDIHEARLEIVDRAERLVVTVIEVLSPANKLPGARGLESFEQKRREEARSPSHWVEIDLLRSGRSLAARDRLKPHSYMVHVSRAEERPRGRVWPIRLDQRLPVVPIPLRPGDPDVPLDLQAVLTTAYDRAGYDLQIDYRSDAVPPLEGEWADWADRLLREKGLR